MPVNTPVNVGGGGGGSGAVDSVNGKTGSVTIGKADVGLSNVDNTSDANKPISTAMQAELDSKAAGTHTHTAAEVGLGNADNTSDANKPVSTAQQAALNEKLDKTGGSVSGDLLLTGGVLGYSTGAGGVVAQVGSKTESVTLNKPSGVVNIAAGVIPANDLIYFYLVNTHLKAGDFLLLECSSFAGTYMLTSQVMDGGAFIFIRNMANIPFDQLFDVRFAIIKGSVS